MPRYHFHSGDISHHPDPDGVELVDDTAAKQMALKFAGQALSGTPVAEWSEGRWRVEVTDADGCLKWIVMTLAIDAPTATQATEGNSSIHKL